MYVLFVFIDALKIFSNDRNYLPLIGRNKSSTSHSPMKEAKLYKLIMAAKSNIAPIDTHI